MTSNARPVIQIADAAVLVDKDKCIADKGCRVPDIQIAPLAQDFDKLREHAVRLAESAVAPSAQNRR